MEKAMTAGVESTGDVDTSFNITPTDILKSLPGITSKNYRYIMAKVKNIHDLTELPLAEIQEAIGQDPGKKLHDFLHYNTMDLAPQK